MAFAFTTQQKDKITGLYQLTTPQIPEGTEHISFYANTDLGILYMSMIYKDSQWWGSCRMGEAGKIRAFRVIPNLLLMEQFDDFGLVLISGYETIPLNGFNTLDIRLVVW